MVQPSHDQQAELQKSMGRRSVHTSDELRQLILDASQSIVERHGIAGLSAREIARVIGYSPGTLYNIFSNLDDVLMTLQVQLMGRAAEHLRRVPLGADAEKNLDAVTDAYVDFALANRRMWNLFLAHSLPPQTAMPSHFHDLMHDLVDVFASALQPLFTEGSKNRRDTFARALLAGINGITAVAATEKGVYLTPATAKDYARELAMTSLRGLSCSEKSRS